MLSRQYVFNMRHILRPIWATSGRSRSYQRVSHASGIVRSHDLARKVCNFSGKIMRWADGRSRNSEAGMTTFDKREEGFEKRFALDEELRFKANARRNKLLGLWAAEKLGKSGAEADAYAKEVVIADLEESGEEDVFRKIRGDFDAKGVTESDHQIRRTMDELMAKAVTEIKAGK